MRQFTLCDWCDANLPADFQEFSLTRINTYSSETPPISADLCMECAKRLREFVAAILKPATSAKGER